MSDEISDEKYSESDPERTLITLDQLSQTIEVMTTVVNRLRRHLSEQLKAQVRERAQEQPGPEPKQQPTSGPKQASSAKAEPKRSKESFVVEINNSQDPEPPAKSDKVLH